jgi:type I restriction enzyme S subunit
VTTDFDVALPQSWTWSALKFTTTYLNRGTAPDYVDKGPIRAVGQAANQASGLDWERTRFHGYTGDARFLKGYLVSGDVLINSTGTGTLGRVGYFSSGPDALPCIADGHVTVARADRAVADPRFMYYWLTSTPFQDYLFSALIVGATNQIELNRERLAASPIALPPLGEQRRIADFLDAELGRIDAVVCRRKQQIGVLRERLCATREELLVGNSTRSVPLMYLTDPYRPIVYGIVQAGDEVVSGVPYIKTGDLPDIDIAKLSRTAREIHVRYSRSVVRPGDIVMAMRASIGTVAMVPSSLPEANLTQGTARIAAAPNVDSLWLLHAVQTRGVREQCLARAVGTTFATLNIWDLRRLQVPFLDHWNQREAALEFERKNSEYCSLVWQIEAQTSLLAERRQALITAAVTGQIDVTTARGVAA